MVVSSPLALIEVVSNNTFMSASKRNTDLPLISIITVVLNGEKHLEQTINSVISQTYKKCEYIIIDGGSTDRSMQIINHYHEHIDRVVSEPDRGIADAMNKGVRLSSGDYLVFIHSDDFFENNRSLAKAAEFFDEIHGLLLCDILFGNDFNRERPRGFNFWINFKGLPHQGVLCKSTVFKRIGLFDTQFRISMDYDFFVRAYRAGIKAKRCPVILSVMRDTGISSQQTWQRLAEEKKVHEKNCFSGWMKMIYQIYWALYIRYRRLKSFLQSTEL